MLIDFRFTLQNYSKIPPKKQASAKVQIFVAEKLCNKLKSNGLKNSYYKFFSSNPVENRVFSEGFSEVGAVFSHRVFAQSEQVGLLLDAEMEEIQKEDISFRLA